MPANSDCSAFTTNTELIVEAEPRGQLHLLGYGSKSHAILLSTNVAEIDCGPGLYLFFFQLTYLCLPQRTIYAG